MKFAFCGLLFFLVSCQRIQQEQQATTSSALPLQYASAPDESLLQRLVQKLRSLVHKKPSPFCQAIVKDSPTRDDYIRNWQPNGDVTFCPGVELLDSCQKKNDDAFLQGLLCYR